MAYIGGIANGNGAGQVGSAAGVAGTGASAPAGKAEGTRPLIKADQATFSQASGLAAQGDLDVRTEKVQALSKAIAEGTYSVPAGDVAGKMIDSLLK